MPFALSTWRFQAQKRRLSDAIFVLWAKEPDEWDHLAMA